MFKPHFNDMLLNLSVRLYWISPLAIHLVPLLSRLTSFNPLQYYTKFAIYVTEWENHKTQTEYENNLTIRRYIFEVFNFYSSLVYIGFFKGK